MMGMPFTIQIFCPDGDPENMRIAEKKNWTGKVFSVSRDFWTEMQDRHCKDLEVPGVYILVGDDEMLEDNSDDLQTIYIGQAENLFTRIQQHIGHPKMSFFRSIVCMTGRDFNNAHFRWMEAHLIQQAKEIDRCTLENGNAPNKPQISESDEVDTRRFLDESLQIFPMFEIDVFIASKRIKSEPPSSEVHPNQRETITYKKPDITGISEMKDKILAAFQKKESVELLQRSRATYYDETRTLRVCCVISSKPGDRKAGKYWFTAHQRQINFLQGGERGYIVFGMIAQRKAVIIPIEEFDRINDKLNTKESDGEIRGWHVYIHANSEKFQLKLSSGKMLDLSPYLFEIA